MSELASSIHEIEAAVAHVAPDRRAKMLGQVTDLFLLHAGQYSDSEIDLFDDVIARLAADIEVEAKILLSQRLAPIPSAPPNVIRVLAFDDCAEVAVPVLLQSERLDETSLVENARTKSQKHLFAISRRRSLGVPVTDVLVRRGDRAVAISVAANAGACLSDAGLLVLIERSTGDDMLAERIGAREEIPLHLYLKLLSLASEKVRGRLHALHPHAGVEVDRVVTEVTDRLRSRAVAAPRDYSATLEDLGARYIDGNLAEADLVGFAQAGRFEDVVVTLALLAGVPVPVVDRAMLGERSDVVLMAARAIGLRWSTTKLILQLWSRPRSLSVADLQQSLASFEQVSQASAQQLMRFHCMAALPRPDKPN
jgi:uncharacterized protein (DUF2336 family)